ncbi:MAG: hypothetical protein A3J63_02265 [Candidatus Moranbacteria bacterium RIFCSPHIGHO2_02_FULL_40_12b]|nr:MAG: hypothetical protein A3J63_02265 [Candidatus Moranbacteria bacterium RIFCSPHIGHO2_02_FULL_40_12b]
MSNKLAELRKNIDMTDKKIVRLMSQRFKLTKKVGIYKRINRIKPYDRKRELEMMKKRTDWGNRMGLDENFIKKLFRMITKEVRKNHKELAGKKYGKK